jgi:hypothetical protein
MLFLVYTAAFLFSWGFLKKSFFCRSAGISDQRCSVLLGFCVPPKKLKGSGRCMHLSRGSRRLLPSQLFPEKIAPRFLHIKTTAIIFPVRRSAALEPGEFFFRIDLYRRFLMASPSPQFASFFKKTQGH